MPRGIAFALVLLAGVEMGARALVHYRIVKTDPNLRTTIETRVDRIRDERPPVWLVGNSTLDWGVDAKILERSTGLPMIKLPHGSATLRATAAMLQYYIDVSGEKPQQVIVTLTKDDLNLNGSRAEFSKRYLEIAASDKLPSADFLMLRRARSNLRARVIDMLRAIHKHAAPRHHPIPVYDGTPLTAEFNAYVALIKNYALDQDAFDALGDVCQRNALPPPIVVLMPVTDQYLLFHDRLIASPKSAQIHSDLLNIAKTHGMPCLDYLAKPEHDYSHFRDPYHLNPTGEAIFTQKLTHDLPPLLVATNDEG